MPIFFGSWSLDRYEPSVPTRVGSGGQPESPRAELTGRGSRSHAGRFTDGEGTETGCQSPSRSLRWDLRDRDVRRLVSVSRLTLDLGVPVYGNSWHMPMARASGQR